MIENHVFSVSMPLFINASPGRGSAVCVGSGKRYRGSSPRRPHERNWLASKDGWKWLVSRSVPPLAAAR
jgi:hypothetical protein